MKATKTAIIFLIFFVAFAAIFATVWTTAENRFPAQVPGGSDPNSNSVAPNDPGPSFYPNKPTPRQTKLFSETIARNTHKYVWDERRQQRLHQFEADQTAQSVAREHSWHMHHNLSNYDPENRYEDITVICHSRHTISFEHTVTVMNNGTHTGLTSDGVARQIVDVLLTNPQYRQMVFSEEYSSLSAGIYVHEETPPTATKGKAKIYVTLDFCERLENRE